MNIRIEEIKNILNISQDDVKLKCKRCNVEFNFGEYENLEYIEIFACSKCGCPHVLALPMRSFDNKYHPSTLEESLINVEKYVNKEIKEDKFGNKIIIELV